MGIDVMNYNANFFIQRKDRMFLRMVLVECAANYTLFIDMSENPNNEQFEHFEDFSTYSN